MTQVAVSTGPIEVATRRIEDGPAVTVAGGSVEVSASVAPANVGAESGNIEVVVSPAIATAQSLVSVPDVSVQVDGPLEVIASTVGIQGPPGTNNGSSALPPDETDESDPTYIYYGWISTRAGGWLVRRVDRITEAKTNAATGYPDFTAAWENRETLQYY